MIPNFYSAQNFKNIYKQYNDKIHHLNFKMINEEKEETDRFIMVN